MNKTNTTKPIRNVKNQMTFFAPPEEIIVSRFGTVSMRRWCELECQRINASNRGDDVRVIESTKGHVAIARFDKKAA